MAQFCENLDLNLRRDHLKKNHMSVATMSRWMIRAYLRLCPKKRRKKNSGGKELISAFTGSQLLALPPILTHTSTQIDFFIISLPIQIYHIPE